MFPRSLPSCVMPAVDKYFVLMVLVLCVALAARIYGIDAASLWADELWGVDACSQGSWQAMIRNLIYKDSHPPGYQTMLYFWMRLFGDSDVSVRMPSVLAGVAAVAALYRLGRTFLNPMIGLLAATILAVSHMAIYYSQEARAYIFILLFAILHYHSFLQLFVRNERSWREWLAFWLVGALLAYFHYVGVVILLAEATVLFFLPGQGGRFTRLVKPFLPVLLLYLPWLSTLYRHLFHSDASWETPVPDMAVMLQTARFLWGPDDFRLYAGMAILAVFLGACLWHRVFRGGMTESQKILLLLLVLSLLPMAMFYLKSHWGRSAYTIRHFIYLIPVLSLVTARFIERFVTWRRWRESRALVFHMAIIVPLFVSLNVSMSLKEGGKLYNDISKIEYRESVETILLDEEFMAQPKRHVFISNKFFDHYLMRFGVRGKPARFFHNDQPQKIDEYRDMISKQGVGDFYYLEVFMNVDTGAPSPLLRELQKHYYTVCVTQFVWVQVVKFSTLLPGGEQKVIGTCPEPTPGTGSARIF